MHDVPFCLLKDSFVALWSQRQLVAMVRPASGTLNILFEGEEALSKLVATVRTAGGTLNILFEGEETLSIVCG